MKQRRVYTAGELARKLGLELQGDADVQVNGLATLRTAGPGKLSFLSSPSYVSHLSACQASIVIIHPDQAHLSPCTSLLSSAPYVSYAHASQLFQIDNQTATDGVHASAVISPDADIAPGVSIGANAVIEEGVRIGSDSYIGPGVYIGSDCIIGNNCRIYANASIYHSVVLGARVIIHSGAVIGADGFGFAFDGKQFVKISQLGGVNIGNDVEIGAGSTIDRGSLDDTLIAEGVKIDNQVQIAHNCRIGKHTIICGCVGIAGSTHIGAYCTLGGGVGIVGHIKLCDRVVVSGMSLVSKSINKPGMYSSGTRLMASAEWKKNIVRLGQLNQMSKRLQELERLTNK
ncbi:MAG: UDP-3-O-(3-hydroxymyristoyl)glucosamine N-acyltransferase [Pseudomonadales bacterium]|nr:UDP-3-O-(3-hydroxymyristoyl)glucosamine N-acyltransferase [Pseudomonadales bacterium]